MIGRRLLGLAVVGALGWPQAASAAERVALLDVPFVAQTPALCGGASAAMVMRYWGDGSADPQGFAPLLREDAIGIRAADLVGALERRGYTALAFEADEGLAHGELQRGRPLILLIDGGAQLHYVVLLAWGSDSVLYHDPALGPHQVRPEEELLAAWEASGRLAILALPASSSVREAAPRHTACRPLIDSALAHAQQDDLVAAKRGLELATRACPDSSLAWRERAGVSFRREEWSDAADLARRSLRLDRDDPLAWRILGASEFLAGSDSAALDAWNQVGEPWLDRTSVSGTGSEESRFDERRLGLESGAVLTARSFRRAERRLADLPIASRARLGLRPLPGGRAELEVALFERRPAPSARAFVIRTAASALAERLVELELAGLAGRGEVFQMGARLWRNRPKLWGAAALPTPGAGPGITTIEVAWEEQTYADAGAMVRLESRRRVAIGWHDWVAPDLRLRVETSLDRFDARRARPGLASSVDRRFMSDRVSLRGRGAIWFGGDSFGSYGLDMKWRSTTRAHERVARFRAGVKGASTAAPLALWAGAGTGHARDIPLRAHPLLEEGVVTGEMFGRRMVHAGVELESGVWRVGPTGVGLALFADWAVGWQGTAGERLPRHLDLGLGLRLALPGVVALRIDGALGVRGGSAVSIGVSPTWPN